MKIDVYSLAAVLSEKIKSDCKDRVVSAEDITDAIDYGNSSGEILMKLNFLMSEIINHKDEYSEEEVYLAGNINREILLLI